LLSPSSQSLLNSTSAFLSCLSLQQPCKIVDRTQGEGELPNCCLLPARASSYSTSASLSCPDPSATLQNRIRRQRASPFGPQPVWLAVGRSKHRNYTAEKCLESRFRPALASRSYFQISHYGKSYVSFFLSMYNDFLRPEAT